MKIHQWLKNELLGNWHERFSVVLAGMFLLQYVLWFQLEDGLWQSKTVVIVKLTLLTTVIIELMFRKRRVLRSCLQLAALVCTTGFVLEYVPIRGDITRLSDAAVLLRDNFMVLSPYIWFSISAWLITLIAVKLMRKKKYIITALILTVTAFAIRDSYSALDLWKHAAAVIVCGLLLLTVRHFADLKQTHQADWQHIVKYSPFIVLSIIFLITIVVTLGFLAPDVRPILKDPYTIWKSMSENRIANSTNGGSTASPNEAPSTIGYSLDDSELDGSLIFDEGLVFTAITSHHTYWRGETRSLYTGSGWAMSERERRAMITSVMPDVSLPQNTNNASNLKTIEAFQTIKMLDESDKEYPVLFGAYAIDKVQRVETSGTDDGFSPLRWFPGVSEVHWIGDNSQAYPDSYTLVSQVPILDEEALRNVPEGSVIEEWLEPYLALPETIPSRVTELALQVTDSGESMYDKAKLLEQFLSSTYAYTISPDLSRGKSHDFVDRFLFEIREGYCDYYSTAMVVMARSIGIPARWVKGFSPGETNGDGVYIVRNSNAHSWVEVYFPGYGWIQFEPTAGFELPVYQSEEGETAELPILPTSEFELDTSGSMTNGGLPHTVWVAGVVIIAILAVLIWSYRKFWPIQRRLDNNRYVVHEFERFLRSIRRKGFSREKHETAREALHRWFNSNHRIEQAELESLLLLFEKAKYGRGELSDEEKTHFSQKVQQIRQELKRRDRSS